LIFVFLREDDKNDNIHKYDNRNHKTEQPEEKSRYYSPESRENELNKKSLFAQTPSNTSLSSLEQNYLEFRTTYVNLFTKSNKNKRIQTESDLKEKNNEIKNITKTLNNFSLINSKSIVQKFEKKRTVEEDKIKNKTHNKQKTKIKFQNFKKSTKENSFSISKTNSTETIISIDENSNANNNNNQSPPSSTTSSISLMDFTHIKTHKYIANDKTNEESQNLLPNKKSSQNKISVKKKRKTKKLIENSNNINKNNSNNKKKKRHECYNNCNHGKQKNWFDTFDINESDDNISEKPNSCCSFLSIFNCFS
jgi:hypothetical protein